MLVACLHEERSKENPAIGQATVQDGGAAVV